MKACLNINNKFVGNTIKQLFIFQDPNRKKKVDKVKKVVPKKPKEPKPKEETEKTEKTDKSFIDASRGMFYFNCLWLLLM